MAPLHVLVAGATGAVGNALVPHLRALGMTVTPHVRPQSAAKLADPQALVIDLADAAGLDAAMARADAVVCLVGTMRKRFAQGDTYQSSDWLPVKLLAESARRAGGRRFVLLSALGARAGGGYLGWKFKAEQEVRDLPHAILRPSFLDDGKERRPPAPLRPLFRALPADWRTLPVEVLCRAIGKLLQGELPNRVLTGRDLWRLAET